MDNITSLFKTQRYGVTAVILLFFLFNLASNIPHVAAQDTTIIVSPDDMHDWTLRSESPNLGPGTGQFTVEPSPAPLGYGSLRLTVDDSNIGESITQPMPTTRFSNITKLTYHTYRVTGSNAQAVTLQFQVCRSYFWGFCIGSSRLIYEPYWTGTYPKSDEWQEWNALAPQAKWWMTGIGSTDTCGMNNPCPVATLLATYPNLDILNSNNIGILLKVGRGWPSFDGYVDDLTIGINNVNTTYDLEPSRPVHNITQGTDHPTIQNGIDNAAPGDELEVDPGTYVEDVVIDKRISLTGAGSGAGGTIVTGVGGLIGVIQLDASGLSTDDPLFLKDIRIEPNGRSGISIGQFNQATGKNISYVALDNVHVVGTNANPCSEQERGLYVDLTSSLSYVTIRNSAFDNLHHGWYLQKEVSVDASSVHHITVEDTTFNHNNFKGIYAEKLSDATFTNITATENGYVGALPSASGCEYFRPWMAGVDINLKAGNYQNITFTDSTFSNNGLDGATDGVGLAIKARDDATSYDTFPASLTGVLVDDGVISGNKAGIRFGEPGKDNSGPVDVRVQNADFSTNIDYSINNQSKASVTVAGNQFITENIVFVKSATGELLAYANNILSFTDAGLTSMTGTFNARHNWWGTYAAQPATVDSDSWAFRLGALRITWADGVSSASLEDSNGGTVTLEEAIGNSGGGTAVLVNHRRPTNPADAPFGKAIAADIGPTNQCSDFYDAFIIKGSDDYYLTIPVDDSAACAATDDVLFQFDLIMEAPHVGAPNADGCTPDTDCWIDISATRGVNSLSATVPSSNLLGTPFVAPSINSNDPTAVSLLAFSATTNSMGMVTAVIFLLLTLTGFTFWKRSH